MRTVNLPESRVLKIWQDCAGRNDLETEEDGPVKVIYPGRINDGSGADFRDAVIQTKRGMLTGDIEIHAMSSDWRAHRHHLDPIYNRVILHVVLRHDMGQSIKLENGRTAPTLVLQKMLAPGDEPYLPAALQIRYCDSSRMKDIDILSRVLDTAGEQRFQSRAAGFQTVVSPDEAGQALYRGIMAALGYAQNKHPMAELACRMPLRRLESIVTAETPDIKCLAAYQALLLGAAGLLPSQRTRCRADAVNERWVDELEKRWSAARETVTMSETDWHFFRVRPGNFPTRRIAAMSRLLLRYREEGLLHGLINRLEPVPVDTSRKLEEALMIEGEDSGSTVNQGKTSWLGRSRAADIVINVLLPFAVAWGRVNSRPGLAEKAVAIYRRYPPLATNTLERHMGRQLGIDGSLVNTARRQQGLLHLFKMCCSLGKCQDCPVHQAV